MSETKFEDTCHVICTDSAVGYQAELHKFHENQYLEIVIKGVVVPLKFNGRGLYVGSKFGMEFTTPGPKRYKINRR